MSDEIFVIEGGRPLAGAVRVGGSKNGTLPVLAASILADGPCRIDNVPHLSDVSTMLEILEGLGVGHRRIDGVVELEARGAASNTAPYELVRRMRASVCVLGPLLARRGEARVSLPGGCVLGVRPIDLHLKGLEAMGARIEIRHGYVEARARRLRGAEIYLGGAFGSTVLGTANVMMAATLAEGRTVIDNAACEPEVGALARFLVAMGARIDGIDSPRLVIDGVERLGGAIHTVIPDRIEAGTLMIAAGMTGGEVRVEGVRIEHLMALLDKLRTIGVEIRTEASASNGQAVTIRRNGALTAIDVTTLTYPGFPTDLQAQFMALLSTARGISLISEKIYPDRFMHVAEFNRMGADIRKEGPTAIIRGVECLSGAPVMATDLRASAGLVIAALAADGVTEISRIYHIDRGYEAFDRKLSTLGARVRRERGG